MTVWKIYLIGFAVALFYITYQYIGYCIKNKVDYKKELRDSKVLMMLVLNSLGSWFSVLFCWVTRDKD